MSRFPAEQGMVGTKRMDKGQAGLRDRRTCRANDTHIVTHFVPTFLFPTPIIDASHVSAQNASCSIPGRVHSRCTYPFLQKENVPCRQDAAKNTASNTQDKNSVPLSNPQENQHKHRPNTLLKHRSNPLPNIIQTTRLHNTPSTRGMQSEGIFPFSRTNVLEKEKHKRAFLNKYPQKSSLTSSLISYPTSSPTSAMTWSDYHRPLQTLYTQTFVFAIHGLHVFVNLNYKYGTSDRTYTTTTVTVAYCSLTKTFEDNIMHFNASSLCCHHVLQTLNFHPSVRIWRAKVTGKCLVCCEICLGTTFFAKVTPLNLSRQHWVVVPVAPRLATYKMNK